MPSTTTISRPAPVLPAADLIRVLDARTVEDLGDRCQQAVHNLTGSEAIGIYLLRGTDPSLIFSADVPGGFLCDYAEQFGARDPLIRHLGRDRLVTDGEASVGADAWRSSALNEMLTSWGFHENMCGLLRLPTGVLGVVYTANRTPVRRYDPMVKEQMRHLCHGAAIALGHILRAKDIGTMELSPQLRRVALLLCEGLSNKEIARALGLSDHTVKEYVQTLMKRCRADNRTALATWLVRSGTLN